MSERTALEVAAILEDSMPICGRAAVIALRRQHAAIEQFKRERYHIHNLLAKIYRDGGQYVAEHGIEKACYDAEEQVVAWLDTFNSFDALIERLKTKP